MHTPPRPLTNSERELLRQLISDVTSVVRADDAPHRSSVVANGDAPPASSGASGKAPTKDVVCDRAIVMHHVESRAHGTEPFLTAEHVMAELIAISGAKRSASQKIAQNRPDVRARRSASQKIANARPDVKAKRSAGTRLAWALPGARAQRSASQKIAQNRPEVLAKQRAAKLGRKFTDEHCAALSAARLASPSVQRIEVVGPDGVYASIQAASRATGIPYDKLRRWSKSDLHGWSRRA